MSDHCARDDSADPIEANDAIDSTEHAEPIDPIDSTEPGLVAARAAS